MERNRQCGLKKSGDYFEVNFSPDDNYVTSVYKAVEAIGWEYDPADGAPFLCRANGIRIVDQPLASGSWTLGEYIKTQFKSMNNVRLGVALFEVRKLG